MDANYRFFMEADMAGYVGQWVAVHDRRVIASGNDFKKVFSDAKKVTAKPFIARVPEKGTMIF